MQVIAEWPSGGHKLSIETQTSMSVLAIETERSGPVSRRFALSVSRGFSLVSEVTGVPEAGVDQPVDIVFAETAPPARL